MLIFLLVIIWFKPRFGSWGIGSSCSSPSKQQNLNICAIQVWIALNRKTLPSLRSGACASGCLPALYSDYPFKTGVPGIVIPEKK